ncbi:hypothetical protein [Nocardiopsis alkaliphila]|uniref:hypothetical protein n=1 Tax=Nocardiopsis alkaliphila TaxID=225762 RepID=UPI00126783E4|nr:hypothetical protein [Nocardiopsis alkaliphila]
MTDGPARETRAPARTVIRETSTGSVTGLALSLATADSVATVPADTDIAYPGGPAMAKSLEGSWVTVTDDGGHGFHARPGQKGLGSPLPCADEAVDAHRVDGADPPDLERADPPRPDVASQQPETEELIGLFQRFEEFDETSRSAPGPRVSPAPDRSSRRSGPYRHPTVRAASVPSIPWSSSRPGPQGRTKGQIPESSRVPVVCSVAWPTRQR